MGYPPSAVGGNAFTQKRQQGEAVLKQEPSSLPWNLDLHSLDEAPSPSS